MISHEKGIFEFTLERSPGVVVVVRRNALEFLERLVSDREVQSRLEVAIHEMLENCVKYSTSRQIDFRLQVTRPPSGEVTITTRNGAKREDIAWLRQALERFEMQADPAAQYGGLMRDAIMRPERSRLGLARILLESSMRVSFRTDTDGTLELVAQTAY